MLFVYWLFYYLFLLFFEEVINMAVEYKFDKQLYMHGACQYFAIQAAEMFHGKVCLWLDRDYMKDEGEDVGLCHAFAKIADGFYVDAAGPFFDISDRDNYYEYNEKRIVECTVEEAKKILKKIGISCTNPEMKKNAREYLRNNMMAFEVLYGDGYYYFGLCGRIAEGTERGSFDFVLLNPYDAKENKFGSMVSKIHTNLFIKGCQMSFGFKPNKGWYYKK